jgi:Flp pilus assembly pilin Flp
MKKSFSKNRDGGTLPEYAILLALIMLVAIATVAVFGRNISTYFTVTAQKLEDPYSGGTSYRFVHGNPVSEGRPANDPFGHNPSDGNFLYGTEYNDFLRTDGLYDGVYGLAGADIIEGSSASEIFVSGTGTDWVKGRGGADTYSYAPGDGTLYIDESGGDASADILNMPMTAMSSLAGARSGDDLHLNLDDGGRIVIQHWFQNFRYEPQLDGANFSDTTISTREGFRDFAVNAQKSSGNVYGTKLVENYSHTVATDGSYTIHEDHYLAQTGRDQLTFTDISPDHAKFKNINATGKSDLVITAGQDVITIRNQNAPRQEKGVSQITFEGDAETGPVVLDITDIRTKAVNDQKSSGSVLATRYTERLVHNAATDGSYTLDNDHYLGDPLETFEILNALPDDVKFRQTGSNSGTSFEITFPGSNVVLIEDGFTNPSSSNYRGVKDILFLGDPNTSSDDVRMDLDAITVKSIEDQRPSGFIRGSQGSETFVYTPADIDIEYYAGYASDSYVDTLDLRAYNLSETAFSVRYGTMTIDFITGQELAVIYQFSGYRGFERILIGDGSGGTIEMTKAELLSHINS